MASVGTVRGVNFGKERVNGFRLALHRSQDIERIHVARSFPDGVERSLAIKARQDRFLDVSISAVAFERLGHHSDRSLACPELADCNSKMAEASLFQIS